MKRQYLLLILLLAPLAFGYTTTVTTDPAKIYLLDDVLFRSVPDKGITIYDVTNPANLRELTTIGLTGNHDVAVRGSTMYADDQDRLVVFDISDRSAPKAVDTIRAVFNSWQTVEALPLGGLAEDRTWTGSPGCGCSDPEYVTSPGTAGAAENADGTGQAGSLTRFAIVGHYLYCIDYTGLVVFDISDPTAPRYRNRVEVGWSIETLFPYGASLFIGGQTGMYVYSIANQDAPAAEGQFQHVRSCDPVVVENDLAYVTLRSGTACGGSVNELDILNAANTLNPVLIDTVAMTGPYGLAVRNGMVVVCDGEGGLRIVDATDLQQVKTVATIGGIVPFDVILRGNLMLVTASDGVFAYDITDITKPTKLTKYVF